MNPCLTILPVVGLFILPNRKGNEIPLEEMAKDPAFLFYPGDYISGTMHLDFECKGAYIDLLMLQFNKDRMSLHMIKQVLGHKFEHIWSLISDKFLENEGLYWNERLRVEKENRVNFCKSRKNNRNSTKHMTQHMYKHMEDEDVNVNESINKDKDASFGKHENLLNGNGTLISQMHDLWRKSFPAYTDDIQHDYPACKSMADFIFKNGKVSNGYGDNDAEIKVLNTMQLIADQVNREPFWVNKPLKSIASNIQEFYNKIKNPINGSGYKSGKQIDEDKLKQKLAERDPSRKQSGR